MDRAREMYSAVMSMTELTHARHAVEDKAVDRRLVTYMDRSILAMSALRESSERVLPADGEYRQSDRLHDEAQ